HIPESPIQSTPENPHVSVIEEVTEPGSSSSNGAVDLEVRESQHEPSEAEPAAEGASRDDTGHEADEEEEDGPTRRTRTRSTASRARSTVTVSPKATRSTADPASAEKPKDSTASKRLERLSRREKNDSRPTSRKLGSDDEEY